MSIRRGIIGLGLGACALFGLALTASAHAPSGAIFTTVADGSEVNYNQYPSKEAVYLDGGPGPGAPQAAAGLDNGVYVFQVTDPSGKKLLSTDNAGCRQFTVSEGIISSIEPSPANCRHQTGLDVDHGATTVQLMPYTDTPNPGGVYKVWVTPLSDYKCPLNEVDCNARGAKHGFVPAHSKTDNFKVKDVPVREIDTRFFRDLNGNGHREDNEEWLLGRSITWTDPLGGTNLKWSLYKPELDVNNEAHVEAIEGGIHQITVANQEGCTVGLVHVDGIDQAVGPQTVSVAIPERSGALTVFVDVACTP